MPRPSNAFPGVQRPCPKSRKQKSPRRQLITPVLRDIQNLRNTTKLLIPLAPFHRVVRSIFVELNSEFRITRDCLEALREAAEIYLVQLFEDAYRCAIHRNRVTLIPKDLELVRYLRGTNDIASFKQ